MNKIFTLFLCTLFAFNLKAQITKKNWLVGGNVGFSSSTTKVGRLSTTANNVLLTGNSGYFVIDKLAIGLQPEINLTFIKALDGAHHTTINSSLGPFLRYYLLPVAKKTNIFIESNYSLGIMKIADLDAIPYHTFSFSAGPEIFLTPSAGILLSVGYAINNFNDNGNYNIKTLQIGAGFEFYFGKH
jgi:hypothetical protein